LTCHNILSIQESDFEEIVDIRDSLSEIAPWPASTEHASQEVPFAVTSEAVCTNVL
jgi:hypothetical protein